MSLFKFSYKIIFPNFLCVQCGYIEHHLEQAEISSKTKIEKEKKKDCF